MVQIQGRWPFATLSAVQFAFLHRLACGGETDSVATAVGPNGVMYAQANFHDPVVSASKFMRTEVLKTAHQTAQQESDATVLQWDGEGAASQLHTCTRGSCLFTTDRAQVMNASAVSWYFPKLDLNDMPNHRPAGQLWITRMDESPCAYELARLPSVHSLFNIAVGMSDRAQVRVCPHVRGEILEQLDAPAVATGIKDAYRRNGTGLVAYIQSNCLPHRDGLVEALEAEGIKVDSFGPCRHNKDLPNGVKAWGKFNTPEFFDVERRYKFAISLENCNCRDYVTEKLFRRLHLGVVPIYEPGPNSDAWLPSSKSIINVSSFGSIHALANELKRLDANATAYEEFLAWKQRGTRETQLGQALHNCIYPADYCAVCDEVLRQRSGGAVRSTLVESPAFGVCPTESYTSDAQSQARVFKKQASHLQFVPSAPDGACAQHFSIVLFVIAMSWCNH